ncbi:MAG: hydrogenase maturation protease [Flavobacteriaceae bacterium]
MKESDNKTLVIGIGNCGRADDVLGWAFIDRIKGKLPGNFDCEYRYQLQVEDAELISHYPVVYFVDADKNQWDAGYMCAQCIPKSTHGFSSHELDPETVLDLSRSIYNHLPASYLLGISGASFQLKMGLTNRAEENLSKALDFFNEKMLH